MQAALQWDVLFVNLEMKSRGYWALENESYGTLLLRDACPLYRASTNRRIRRASGPAATRFSVSIYRFCRHHRHQQRHCQTLCPISTSTGFDERDTPRSVCCAGRHAR